MEAPEACRWCGQPRTAAHGLGELCPFVKAISFDPASGKVSRVEFVLPADLGAPAKEKPEEEPAQDYPRKRPLPGY